MSAEDDEVEISKWYTHTRKFPQFIGKTHNGNSLWGGPYTFTQIGLFVAIIWVGTKTYDWWARSDIVSNAVTLVAVAYGASWLAGKLPIGMRSPLSVALGIWKAFSSPSTGRYGGSAIRIAKPHRVTGCTQLLTTPVSVPAPALAQPAVAAANEVLPAGDPTPARRLPALTGVQLLLAAGSKPQS